MEMTWNKQEIGRKGKKNPKKYIISANLLALILNFIYYSNTFWAFGVEIPLESIYVCAKHGTSV